VTAQGDAASGSEAAVARDEEGVPVELDRRFPHWHERELLAECGACRLPLWRISL
jgi:hypothetical protein